MLNLMYSKNSIMMVAFGLITSAYPALAGDIIISAVPYTISSAGTYILNSDLTSTDTSQPAITIDATNLTGPVVLNLKGHTIDCLPPGNTGIIVYASGGSPGYPSNAYPVTVENGTINQAGYGVEADGVNTLTVKGLTIWPQANDQNKPVATAVYFSFVVNCVVENCTFNGYTDTAWFGVQEVQPGGNIYRNITVKNPDILLQSIGGNDQQVVTSIDNCKLGSAAVPPLQ